MHREPRFILSVIGICAFFAASGCLYREAKQNISTDSLPKELNKVMLPEHVIEPPDILQINAVQMIPLPPYKVQSLDVLSIQVPNALAIAPIGGLFTVTPDGTIELGSAYEGGVVKVVGLTLDQAKTKIVDKLKGTLKVPDVIISVAQYRGVQQIAGSHLVRTDGTVYLGTYGAVAITGMTLKQAKQAIERHLANFLQDPEITIDVLAYNSKVYYIVLDGGGTSLQIYRLPITGNDTVLDALSQLYGLGPVSDKNKIWVARPSPADAGCDQILPVDLVGIAMKGRTDSNFQLMPGDRLYVKAKPLITVDTALGRVTAPFERIFGFALLGTSTARSFGPHGGTSSNP